MLQGSALLLSKALLTLFALPWRQPVCLGTTSPLPGSPIPFHELSLLSSGSFPALPCCLCLCPALHPSALVAELFFFSVSVLKCCPKALGPGSGL